MLGDPHQLPPVESGLFFGDLVNLAEGPLKDQVTMLSKCMRAELDAIVNLAATINSGSWEQFNSIAAEGDVGCKFYDPALPSYEIQKRLIDASLPRYPCCSDADPAELLTLFNDFKLLTPLRKGPFGVDALNGLIKEAASRKLPKGAPLIAPILIASNDYRLELYNGETGVLIKQDARDEKIRKGDIALFPSNDPNDDTLRSIPALLLPRFEYAYAMSIYKSQGSEFNEVLIFLPDGASHLGRDILYTAATRAKKKLQILSTEAALKATIEKQSQRFSCIFDRLA
jgi:exodeoxyribonuclease V alpha subunit